MTWMELGRGSWVVSLGSTLRDHSWSRGLGAWTAERKHLAALKKKPEVAMADKVARRKEGRT